MALLQWKSWPLACRRERVGFCCISSVVGFLSLLLPGQTLLARGASCQDCAVYFAPQLTEKYSLALLEPARDQT